MKRMTAWLSLIALCALVATPHVRACPKAGCGSVSKEKAVVAEVEAPKGCGMKSGCAKAKTAAACTGECEGKNCAKEACVKVKAAACTGECEGKNCAKEACVKVKAAACTGECEGKNCAKEACVKVKAAAGCGKGAGACSLKAE